MTKKTEINFSPCSLSILSSSKRSLAQGEEAEQRMPRTRKGEEVEKEEKEGRREGDGSYGGRNC